MKQPVYLIFVICSFLMGPVYSVEIGNFCLRAEYKDLDLGGEIISDVTMDYKINVNAVFEDVLSIIGKRTVVIANTAINEYKHNPSKSILHGAGVIREGQYINSRKCPESTVLEYYIAYQSGTLRICNDSNGGSTITVRDTVFDYKDVNAIMVPCQ